MTLDLTGIENIEFYAGHYLDALLESDLKDVFSRWKKLKDDKGQKPPFERLRSLSTAWYKARAAVVGVRDTTERWEAARAFHAELIEVLGFQYSPSAEALDGDELCPVLTSLSRGGSPELWIVDAPFRLGEEDSALDSPILQAQYDSSLQESWFQHVPKSTDPARRNEFATWRELLDTRIFRLESGPRWVLFLAGDEIFLAERNKWLAGRFLRFDLADIFSRLEAATLRAVCGLIHRDALAPEEGGCLHDTLEENSHKHAYAVSGDLKYGVRRGVELLANEAVWYRREHQKKSVYSEEELAEKLKDDCLTWMYRLLFLFYVEARGAEVGIVPMKSDAYRTGYSLESLRALELVELVTDEASNGHFIDASLKTLFRIVNDGFGGDPGSADKFHFMGDIAMQLQGLRSPLFDDDHLEILKGVKFRNHVLQEVLQLLSLSKERPGKKRGRISYAQLGINQLGSVYESLLSYSGFFASEQDGLYEVAKKKDVEKIEKSRKGKGGSREDVATYFVPASRKDDFEEGEFVRDANGKPVVHPKGKFIYALAGRNREKSASYYTPEVLTQCLVKYALKELLWEEGENGDKPGFKKTADEILALTICEPAMGSSAFLIEAVDQLADAYLEARQEEVKASGGETIAPEDYQREKRRVKARLATNNCYGVDLNPTAVELAKVSLWLATLHEDGKCPWFGLRLATGNSLVGARREVFKTADVTRKGTKDAPNWLGLVPEPVPLHHSPEEGGDAPGPDEVDWENWTAPPRPKGTIYHFLLPAEGMAAFDKDKVIKQLAPESVKRIKEWRKEFCKPFKKSEAERLEQISDAVDRLFAQVVRERVLATQETSDRIPVWGEPPSAQQADLLVRDQEEVAASLEDGSSAYRRLKLAMDAWCALWFWPIEQAELLPDRATWIAQMELVLKGQVTYEPVYEQGNLFDDVLPVSTAVAGASESTLADVVSLQAVSAERLKRLQSLSDAFRERRVDYLNDCGLADIDVVLEGDPNLRTAQAIADHLRFHHWPLRFAEVFAERDGFDLSLGNPPWVKLAWDESGILSEFRPSISVRGLKSVAIDGLRPELLDGASRRQAFLDEFSQTNGLKSFLGSELNYPLLAGQQTDLYRCFIPRSWALGAAGGVVALLHPQSVFSDSKAGALREQIYPRIAYFFHFVNQLSLFADVLHTKHFTANVYRARPSEKVRIRQISHLYHPSTIDECIRHDGHGAVPSMKTDSNEWELRGHRGRLVEIDDERLSFLAEIYGSGGVPSRQSRMPLVHNEGLVRVLESFERQAAKVGGLRDRFYATEMWHETNAERDGILARKTIYPAQLSRLVLSGPHVFVACPLAKTPNADCKDPQDYSPIDLQAIATDYLPRTNFVPALADSDYATHIPTWNGKPITAQYRLAVRRRLDSGNERTLAAAILPPGPSHINGLFSITAEAELVVLLAGSFSSLPFDFWVKSTGKGDFRGELAELLPQVPLAERKSLLVARVLRLNCLTDAYRQLWEDAFRSEYSTDGFTCDDRRFLGWSALERRWNRSTAIRSEIERRQALIELDVIVSMSLGMNPDELVDTYRAQFPILQKNERGALYDQAGRQIPTAKSVRGVDCVPLGELAATLKEQAGFDVHAEYHPDGSNTQELREQKIKLGKKEADVLGVSERCTMADLLAETEVRWSDEDHPEGRPVRLVGLRYTDPGLEPRMERVYPTPWTRCDREEDYRTAWAEFERRLAEKGQNNSES